MQRRLGPAPAKLWTPAKPSEPTPKTILDSSQDSSVDAADIITLSVEQGCCTKCDGLWREYSKATVDHVALLKELKIAAATASAQPREMDPTVQAAEKKRNNARKAIRDQLAVDHTAGSHTFTQWMRLIFEIARLPIAVGQPCNLSLWTFRQRSQIRAGGKESSRAVYSNRRKS